MLCSSILYVLMCSPFPTQLSPLISPLA
uniref:Uncharacterized protein n=1 Tax=Anguilla anguilla TaxID=7936 RepID=A0A0E9TME9_ANGAN